MTDNVNHPAHYETGKYECIDVMREAIGENAVKAFCVCNAFKYLYRSERKGGDRRQLQSGVCRVKRSNGV